MSYAKFSDKELKGKYYISLDGYAGEVNGKVKFYLKLIRMNLRLLIYQNMLQEEKDVSSVDGVIMVKL